MKENVMRKVTLLLVLLSSPLVAGIAFVALAQPAALESYQVGSEVMAATSIDTACQANPTVVATASLTCAAFELDMRGFTKVWLLIDYTRTSATEIQIAQDGAVDVNRDGVADLPWGILQSPEAGTAGVVTLSNEQGKKAVTASTASIVEYDVNAPFVRWRFTSTSGAAGDTIRVLLVRRGP